MRAVRARYGDGAHPGQRQLSGAAPGGLGRTRGHGPGCVRGRQADDPHLLRWQCAPAPRRRDHLRVFSRATAPDGAGWW